MTLFLMNQFIMQKIVYQKLVEIVTDDLNLRFLQALNYTFNTTIIKHSKFARVYNQRLARHYTINSIANCISQPNRYTASPV